MAVLVTRMMASCELRIWGSGTCSTLTFFLPIQQLAFIARLPWFGSSGGLRRGEQDVDRGECWRPNTAPPQFPELASSAAGRSGSVGPALRRRAWRRQPQSRLQVDRI